MTETQPSVWLFDIRIDEPVTVITNLLVTAVCFYAYFRVKDSLEVSKFQRFIKYYFLILGVAVGIGGIAGHGFLYALSIAWKLPGWLLSIISITLLERAIIEKTRFLLTHSMHNFLIWVSGVKLVAFMFLTSYTVNFQFVGYHTGLGLLFIVASCSAFTFFKIKNTGSSLYVLGVMMSALSGVIFMNKWGVSMWFNHIDISHVFMSMACYFFYKATVNLNIKQVDGIMVLEK
ncbi:MAG: hypothetical protein OEX22_03880 [Cyclobacteriaceae bacterium]|nr:hypothetical protein [Cyclobacteriaceae bacterium]